MSDLLGTKSLSKEDKKMLNSIFLRSFLHNAGYTGAVKFCASGYIISQMPAINRYTKGNKQAKIEAMQRHNTWYNASNCMNPLVMSITSAMEKEYSEDPNFDIEAVSAIKASLMGPISGIGDSLAWGVFLCIAQAIGIGLSANGSVLGPIAFFVLYNIPVQLIRYVMTYLGWNVGTSFLSTLYESGLMKVVTKSCGILGLIMVGAMTAANVSFSTSLALNIEGTEFPIQTYIDQIFPGLLPLLATLLCMHLLKKNISATKLLLGIYVLSILFAVLHIC